MCKIDTMNLLMTICDASKAASVMSFSSPEVWNWIIQIGIVAIGLLLGNILRRQVPFLRKSLLPSALLGGALLLIFKAIPGFTDLINKQSMEIITYHALGIGFVALALKNNRIESSSSTMKVVETGVLTVGTYIIQGLVGLIITIFMFYLGDKIFYAAGLLLPMGYGQGPGQALNFGTIYAEKAAQQGIEFSGADFGLSIAAMGFIVGSVVGVIYMNILRKKGKLKINTIEHKQINTLADYESKNEIPDSESVDKLSIQVSLVLFVYMLVFLFINWIQNMELGDFGTNTLKPMLWGFNFLLGTLFGVLVKWIMGLFKKVKIIEREYVNNYLLNRVSGFCFDVMIVSGTAAINFTEFKGFIWPFVLVCVFGAIMTFIYVNAVCKQIYPDYRYEGFFSMFGMLTGTASNGMILLREIDPKFETPAANNLVLQTFPAIALGFPFLLMLGFAPMGMNQTLITFGILLALFVILTLFLFRNRIFKKRKK